MPVAMEAAATSALQLSLLCSRLRVARPLPSRSSPAVEKSLQASNDLFANSESRVYKLEGEMATCQLLLEEALAELDVKLEAGRT